MAIKQKVQKHQEHHFEFFGPHVPGLLLLVLPAVLYALVYGCNTSGCLQIYPTLSVPGFAPGTILWSSTAMAVFSGWMLLVLMLHVLLPGLRAEGVLLPNGKRLSYKLNAFSIFVILYGSAVALAFGTPYLPLSYVYDAYVPLLTASVVFSIALSVYLYLSSFSKGLMLAAEGTTGYPLYDFWMGRELNPRIFGGRVDLKEFCELYPGLIGWAIINLGMAHKQYAQLGYITNAMLLTNSFQLYYVIDGLWNERAILTTMDITTDGFGYMLAFGDLAWVPFVFSTVSRFLVDNPQDLSLPYVALVLAVKIVGYWVFRGANGQKDTFRSNPNHPSVKHLKTLETERGTQLLISGWWGTARHINYLGDWIMGVSWCLPAGIAAMGSVVPYFYCIYFATLLVHRERRDDDSCRKKYGKDWDKYCTLVPSRIIPYVY